MYLEIRNIQKTYNKETQAIRNINIYIKPGIMGLFGPNGAGKTSLLKIVTTIEKPDSGEIFFNGKNILKRPQEVRKVLGYLPQDFGFYNNLNAIENLLYIGSLKGIDSRVIKRRINELLGLLNLYEIRKQPLGNFSGGMKQRLGIAQALLNDPQILILDEPTSGLDPEERIEFKNMISNISEDRIVIISTHIVSDLEAIASKVAIMNNGNLLYYDTPSELLLKANGHIWEAEFSVEEFDKIKGNLNISNISNTAKGKRVRAISRDPIKQNAIKVLPNFEDAYLYLTSYMKVGKE